jgi:hypothetical protein
MVKHGYTITHRIQGRLVQHSIQEKRSGVKSRLDPTNPFNYMAMDAEDEL